jgi:hypothetical protein
MTKNPTYRIVKGIAYGMFGAGLALSVTHIYDLFHNVLGSATLTAAAMPLFIDGLQVIGKLMRGESFASQTRTVGFRVQLLGALLSLAANVIAGHALGDKIAGVILVGGYILAEKLAETIRPVQADVQAIAKTRAAAKSATRSAAAQKAAATRAANKAEAVRKAAEKAERAKLARLARQAEINALDGAFAAPSAPVSPAPIDYDAAPYL